MDLQIENVNYKKCKYAIHNVVLEPELLTEKSNVMSEQFKCPICYNIVYDPIECNKCNNLFCKHEFEEFKRKNNRNICPLKCSNMVESQITNKKLKQILNDLEFKCINYLLGCNQLIRYENFFKHISECEFSDNYICLGENCGFTGKKLEIIEHTNDCILLQIQCQFCLKKIIKLNFNDHIEFCDERLVECSFCRTKMSKKDLDVTHKKEDCFRLILNLHEIEKRKLKDEFLKEKLEIIKKKDVKHVLDLELNENINEDISIFKNILSSGFSVENNSILIKDDLLNLNNNEYYGTIIANDNEINWVIIEFNHDLRINEFKLIGDFKTISLNNMMIKEYNFISIKYSNDGRSWSIYETNNLNISEDNGAILNFKLNEIIKMRYLMITFKNHPININYIKIQLEKENSKRRFLGGIGEVINTLDGLEKNFNSFLKNEDAKFIKYTIGNSSFDDQQILKNIKDMNNSNGIIDYINPNITINFDNEYEFNEIEIAGKVLSYRSRESSMILTSIDGDSWYEVGILPPDYCDEIITVKLLRSKARYIKFLNRKLFSLRFLNIKKLNLAFDETNPIFLDFAISKPYFFEGKPISNNNLKSLNDALLVDGFTIDNPGYLILKLKKTMDFNVIKIGGHYSIGFGWKPENGKSSDIFISESSLKDSWINVCKIPENFEDDIIDINLGKIYSARYIKIIHLSGKLGIGYLSLETK